MEIEKNTVPAYGQLAENEYISFEGAGKNGVRIAFMGNSITRHGPAPQIGWKGDWGMAASAKENDYVHLILRGLERKNIAVSACICNGSKWEQSYGDFPDLGCFKKVKLFLPDILVMRVVENCPVKDFLADRFEEAYGRLVDYVCSPGNTKVILTTGFWEHPGDRVIKKIAAKRGYPLVCLGGLWKMDSMKAAGRFAHTGVAAHPGDAGMERIAKEILATIDLSRG